MKYYSLLIPVFVTLIFVTMMLIYGFKINKREIIVVKAKYTFLLFLVLILWFAVEMYSLQQITHKYRLSISSYIIVSLIIVLGLFLFRFYPNYLHFFNIRKDVMYDNLESILLKYGVEFEFKKSKLFITNSKVFVRIGYNNFFKTCNLSFSHLVSTELIGKVFEDLKNQLNYQKSDSKSIMGVTFIILSVIIFMIEIFYFVLWFLLLRLNT